MSKKFKSIKVLENFVIAALPTGVATYFMNSDLITTIIVGVFVAAYGFIKWHYKNLEE